MNEDLPPSTGSRRAAARETLAARRQRARAIRRRVAGMSLATFLAASGAALVQVVSGHETTLARGNRATSVAVASRSTGSDSGTDALSSSAAATSPSAVTTSAS